MTLIKNGTFILLGSLVTACSSPETATRNAPLSTSPLVIAEVASERSYDLQDVFYSAPSDLLVSEGNGFYPNADVVWRGDPIGNRINQIAEIFDTALARVDENLTGNVPVDVEISLVRFHGVTERTRFSIGGNYDIHFTMSVRHAETGEVLEPPRLLKWDLAAPGGAAALLLEQRGQTEKVRIIDFLTYTFEDELTGPIAL